MSTHIKDGGPAFPCQDPQAIHAVAAAAIAHITDSSERDRAYMEARAAAVGGMSLRDVFAGQAMKAFISTAGVNCLGGLEGYEDNTAAAAYRMADAMLKARAA